MSKAVILTSVIVFDPDRVPIPLMCEFEPLNYWHIREFSKYAYLNLTACYEQLNQLQEHWIVMQGVCR